MYKLYQFCKEYNLDIRVEFDTVVPGIVYRFYDKVTRHVFSYNVRNDEIESIKDSKMIEEYLYERAIRELKLDKTPYDRITEFFIEENEPDETWITCKNCNGSGVVQVAPNARGIKQCECCGGKGKVKVK